MARTGRSVAGSIAGWALSGAPELSTVAWLGLESAPDSPANEWERDGQRRQEEAVSLLSRGHAQRNSARGPAPRPFTVLDRAAGVEAGPRKAQGLSGEQRRPRRAA